MAMTPVRRVGDTIRRQAGPWTDTIQDLLHHVRTGGLDWVPEPRGRDAEGREVLGFIDGDVHDYPLPEWMWGDDVLVAVAAMLRRYHDATRDFVRPGARWRLPVHEPVEVVCHNDFAPYNLVFRGRTLSGVIDFDTASPGPRAWDLAYTAYRFVPLTAPENPDTPTTTVAEQARRLARFCAAYGAGVAPREVLAVAADRLDELRALTLARPGRSADAALYEADVRYLRARREALGG
jgi:phosphotransferase family enzyme